MEMDLAQVEAARAEMMKRLGLQSDQPRVSLIQFSSVKPQAITWLWPQWLPGGKLTILAGDGGTGKTTLALALAACVSTGSKWPDGTGSAKPGNVLIWSGEDDIADTLAPRLIAAGADMTRCYCIDGMVEKNEKRAFDPAADMSVLADRIKQLGGASLLIVDPIVSAVAGDMHRANDVRRSLQSLVDLGTANGCAVLGISHFSKSTGGGSPLHRVTGSQAFGALARMVLVTARREGSEERVLTRAKSNIAIDGGGIVYGIDYVEIGGGIFTTRTSWGETVEGTAREIIGDVEYRDNEDGSEKEDAEQFLRGLLADGPVPSKQIKADAEGAGYSWATIRRAQKSIGVEAVKDSMKGGWSWRL